jgi:hypothetical protein
MGFPQQSGSTFLLSRLVALDWPQGVSETKTDIIGLSYLANDACSGSPDYFVLLDRLPQYRSAPAADGTAF